VTVTISTSFGPSEHLITVHGDLDLATVDQFREVAEKALTDLVGLLRIDLADMTFMDSTGIGVLVMIRNSVIANGVQTLVLENVPHQARRVLELTGLLDVFGIE
jgi:anti-anti-sigma factor